MAQSNINDMWMQATSATPAQVFVQLLDATGTRSGSLSVTLKSVEFSATAMVTLRAKVLAGNDGVTWFPLPISSPMGVEIPISGTGAGRVIGASEAVFHDSPRGWRWLRVQYDLEITSGTATADAFISASLNFNP